MSRPRPDLDADEEIDLGGYAAAVAARWWLPLLGLLGGVALAYALTLGGGDVWRARATVYLGQPTAPTGAQVQSLSTNPSTVNEILRSGATLRSVAEAVGVEEDELAVSSQPVSGNLAKQGQNPLVAVVVVGEARGKVAGAANLFAVRVVDRIGGYATRRRELLTREVVAGEAELRRLTARIAEIERAIPQLASERIAALTALNFAEQRRSALREDLLVERQTLALIDEVETPRVVERAAARKVTAQSRRNALVVGGFLGLLAGLAAALAWDSASGLRRRA